MSTALLEQVAQLLVFLPRTRFVELAEDHVRFDVLADSPRYERLVLDTIAADTRGIFVVGPRGGGKSSLVAYVCRNLPETHIALRVPVLGADNSADVSAVAAIALSTALSELTLQKYQRDALNAARADSTATTQGPTKAGGRLGGGPVPIELHAELESLGHELNIKVIARERLAGLDRLISILVSRGLSPVFVMEDTEAVVAGSQSDTAADDFFRGPVKAFLTEIEATLLLAVQTPIAESSQGFAELAPSVRRVELPAFQPDVAAALSAIADQRLRAHDIAASVRDVITDQALLVLVHWFDESGRSFRLTLAALQSAAEKAADASADAIAQEHALAAVADWRSRD